tara:strand:- start:266 stop:943 length:678 start_codon:yes stop_codon:yes gene_type:complete
MVFCLLACSSNDETVTLSNLYPGSFNLEYPENEQACLDGSILNDLQSRVNLRWSSSKNSSKYQISIKNLNDNSNLMFESNSNSQEVILKHGEPYAWKVTAEVPESSSSLTSKEWRFYLAGLGEVNYAPFPPELISPRPSAKVNLNSNDQVLLNWSCTDPDSDIKGYKVYLDSTDGSNLIASFDETKNQVLIAVGATAETNYFWKVIAYDNQGNTASSGVYSFSTN